VARPSTSKDFKRFNIELSVSVYTNASTLLLWQHCVSLSEVLRYSMKLHRHLREYEQRGAKLQLVYPDGRIEDVIINPALLIKEPMKRCNLDFQEKVLGFAHELVELKEFASVSHVIRYTVQRLYLIRQGERARAKARFLDSDMTEHYLLII
jgi:Arc/MetJ-type ribon-helix-helix transcriptional regulator